MTYIPHQKHEVVGEHIIFEKIVHDNSPANPLEDWDCTGKIYSFSSRHVNGINEEQFEAYKEEYGEDLILLSYFEHGRCLWGVKGVNMTSMPDFRWDGVEFAGIWVPDKYLLEEAEKLGKDERRDKMVEWASQACEVYTQWCNGDVYGVVVEAYKVRHTDDGLLFDEELDYRHDVPVCESSCWGFFGYDHAEEELKEYKGYALKELEEKKEKVG